MTSIYDGLPGDPPFEPSKAEAPAKRSKKREGLTTSERRSGETRLFAMVQEAFNTLEEAMRDADHPTAVKAALGILDRTGFGPQSKLDVTTTSFDLTSLTKEQLAERARRVADLLASRGRNIQPTIIDVTPVPPAPSESVM